MGGEKKSVRPLLSGRYKATIIEFSHGRPDRQHCYPDVHVLLFADKLTANVSSVKCESEFSELFSVPVTDVLGSHILRPRIIHGDEQLDDDKSECHAGSQLDQQNNPSRNYNPVHSDTNDNFMTPSAAAICDGLSLQRRMHIFAQSPVSVYLALVTYSDCYLTNRKAVLILKFDKYSDGMLPNVHDAERWQKMITILARQAIEPVISASSASWRVLISADQILSTNVIDIDRHTVEDYQKRFLVFINPSSGAGNSIKLFQQEAVPVLREAVVSCRIVLTEYAQQAFQMVQILDLRNYDAIVIVSGDGLCFEIINGLMKRADGHHVISTLPISHIPGGSGNALAANVEHRATGLSPVAMTVAKCALMTARCFSIPMDIYRVELCDKSTLYGFLTITFGLIADIDIDSEKLRFTGGTRFFIYSLYRYLRIKRYMASVSYLPAVVDENGNAVINDADKTDASGLSSMPSISEPVPSTWTTLPFNEFHALLVCCLSHISSAAVAAPGAQLDDGLLHLMALRGDAPRSIVRKYLLGLENGNLEANCGKYLIRVPVTAVRIVPLSDNTHMVVDGERVKFGPIQAQVLPRKARVIAHRPKSSTTTTSSSSLAACIRRTSGETAEPFPEVVI